MLLFFFLSLLERVIPLLPERCSASLELSPGKKPPPSTSLRAPSRGCGHWERRGMPVPRTQASLPGGTLGTPERGSFFPLFRLPCSAWEGSSLENTAPALMRSATRGSPFLSLQGGCRRPLRRRERGKTQPLALRESLEELGFREAQSLVVRAGFGVLTMPNRTW